MPAIRYGGPIYSVHGLARAQARRGDDVHVFTTNVNGPGESDVPLGVPVDIDGVKVWYFSCGLGRRFYYSSGMVRALARQAATFDVIHAHAAFSWTTVAAARAARAAGVPYVVAPRGMLVEDLIRRKNSKIKRAWISLFETANVERAAAVHVTSEIEAEEIRKLGIGMRRVAVIPNGIDLRDLAKKQAPDVKPYVLSLGRINWKKGLDRLIAAIVNVPGVELILAGNDEDGYLTQLKELAFEHGVANRVTFPGYVSGEAKWELIMRAAVFVLPSYSENFGNAVLEAMACGTAVVVTPEVGLASVVESAGAGLVSPGTPAELGSAINGLILDREKRDRLGRAGRVAAESMFSWDSIGEQMDQCYRDVARR